jgi:hypothetical protein
MTKSAYTITKTRPFLLAAGAALLLAGLAGCGGANNSNNNNPSASAGSASSQNFVADAYRYSACMRSHGVPSFPDPHVVANTPGHQAIGIHPMSKALVNSPQFKTAREACKGIMPGAENGNPKEATEQEHARARYMLAFAQCLRSHGIAGFPDPTAQGELTPATVRAAGVDLQAPSFLVAAKACVGVTRGALTVAQVEQAIHHPDGSQGGGGAQSSGGGQ